MRPRPRCPIVSRASDPGRQSTELASLLASWGLDAAALRDIADALYPAGDPRRGDDSGHARAATLGRYRSRLRSIADALDEAS